MKNPDFIPFLKSLKSSDWERMVTTKWDVKDVVAHLIGWEKEDANSIERVWRSKEITWFYATDNFDAFNTRSISFYKGYTPRQLIAEWEHWRAEVQKCVAQSGEENLRA